MVAAVITVVAVVATVITVIATIAVADPHFCCGFSTAKVSTLFCCQKQQQGECKRLQQQLLRKFQADHSDNYVGNDLSGPNRAVFGFCVRFCFFVVRLLLLLLSLLLCCCCLRCR